MNDRVNASVNDISQRVAAAVEAFARGELVVVADDDDRENEGDLFVAASLCTPEKMAFIIRHTSGIVCTPVSAEDRKSTRLNSSHTVISYAVFCLKKKKKKKEI